MAAWGVVSYVSIVEGIEMYHGNMVCESAWSGAVEAVPF